VWVAVGGSPQSVVRAGTLGLPLTLAIIGGQPARSQPLVDLYREAARAPATTRTARASRSTRTPSSPRQRPGRQRVRVPYLSMMNRIGRERGWPPSGQREYEALRSPTGALAVGSAEQVAEKILLRARAVRHDRYIAQMSVGAVAHADVLRSMELFGTKVAPLVRAEVARRDPRSRTSCARPARSASAARTSRTPSPSTTSTPPSSS
jgi:alkanesulfonate monooxygenase SsuD/methylene tetrahydromethanopterin reductase-like flavin-dependent oxidoreductase (luciferase family)